jgi:hypothetical protein
MNPHELGDYLSERQCMVNDVNRFVAEVRKTDTVQVLLSKLSWWKTFGNLLIERRVV